MGMLEPPRPSAEPDVARVHISRALKLVLARAGRTERTLFTGLAVTAMRRPPIMQMVDAIAAEVTRWLVMKGMEMRV